MIRSRALIVGTFVASACAASAQAADPPGTWNPGPLSYDRPAPRYVELVSGWYIRGDIGYRFNHLGSVEATNAVTSHKYPDSLGLTFGAGYKYQWFRSDITLDYAPRVTARASSVSAAPQPQYTTKLDALSLLANFYVDLGTWGGFTPYVGGGAGVSYLRGREYTDTTLPINYEVTNGRTNFSWAAMAGVAFQVKPNWVIDVGYRHLELGDLPTSTGSGLVTDHTTWKRLSTDEVRLGFRLLLD